MCKVRQYYVFLLVACTTVAFGQQTSYKMLSLEDMSAFKSQAGNWFIVGDVSMDPAVDVHAEHKPIASENDKKRKKEKNEPMPDLPKAVTFQSGNGILLNINSDSKKDNLITTWEHGDIELELEVMLPKGSNSGIFLQGRYEIQLFDSWGVKTPQFSDIGGIYRNWETEADKIYLGKAPLSNPSKAPGLWQKMKISFRAPKFDTNGKKIANAKFMSVELNGVKIHDNVEVPLLTGAPIENNEKPTGPLMIQGDHGPVAFRNIKYKLMNDVTVSLSALEYKAYHGHFKTIEDFIGAKPFSVGTIPQLTYEVVDTDDVYAAIFKGNITVPEDNTYKFLLAYSGGAQLVVNNKKLVDFQRADGSKKDGGTIELKAGTYAVEIYNYKDVSWVPPRLALYVSTAGSYPQSLHSYNSYPPDENPVSSIFIEPGSSTKLLRAFVDFKGDQRKRLTHTIGVGDPNNIHYIYDLKNGNLVAAWRGNFVDATPMWHDRGDGSFLPRGAVQFLFNNQPLAYLKSNDDAFPILSKEGEYRGKGYQIDESTGRPTFKYIYEGMEAEDKIYPDDNNRILTHEVVLKNNGTKPGLYYKLAEGDDIIKMANGTYVVDQQYYIKPIMTTKPFIRDRSGKKELVVAVDGSAITYSIIW